MSNSAIVAEYNGYCGIGTITPGRLPSTAQRRSARMALMLPEAPPDKIMFCQSEGIPSRRAMYSAQCCLIISIPKIVISERWRHWIKGRSMLTSWVGIGAQRWPFATVQDCTSAFLGVGRHRWIIEQLFVHAQTQHLKIDNARLIACYQRSDKSPKTFSSHASCCGLMISRSTCGEMIKSLLRELFFRPRTECFEACLHEPSVDKISAGVFA